MLIERYDKALVDEQRAAAAYQVTEARLKSRSRPQAASKQQVAALAAEEYESGGGFGTMAAMLGNSGGPQAFLNRSASGTVLAQARHGRAGRGAGRRRGGQGVPHPGP